MRWIFIFLASTVALRAVGADVAVEPEKAVVVDLHRPWLDGANWDQNSPPAVYGVDATRDEPRFSVVDPNALSLWVYRFSLPIDITKYPILTMKYRAKGASKTAPYVLRLVTGSEGGRNRVDVGQASDLICDDQVHELRQDLRELNADGSLNTFGIGLKTDDQPAYIDLVELKLSAVGGGEKLKEETPVKIRVTDSADKPIVGAKAILDAERSNFARSASTDMGGEVSITPLANEQQKHMVRVEKDGFLTIEVPNAVSESGQSLVVKTMPAVRYGGIAKDSEGRVASSAQISIKLKPELLQELPMRFQTNIVTSDTGEWKSLPLPADSSQLLISLTQRTDARPQVTQLEPAKLQMPFTKEENRRNLPQIEAAIIANGATGAQPAGAIVDAGNLPSPESAIVLDLHHPWMDASKYERNPAPVVHGIDLARVAPRITLHDPNAKTMWALRLNLPIDAKQYPILKFKYRASNVGAQEQYVVRIAHGTAQDRKIVKFFKFDDLNCDGEVHELTADLREQKVEDSVVEVAVALWSDDKPAWVDLAGVSFAAPQELAQRIGNDPEIKFTVSTLDGNPLAGAKVTVDSEWQNIARSAQTNEKGEVSIKPRANDAHVHMARVEKSGFMPVSHVIQGNSAELKTVPAVRYGGEATGESGQVESNAQITVRAKNQFLRDTGLPPYPLVITTTDEKGHWSTPPLPSDVDLLTIQCKQPVSGGDPTVSQMDVAKSQQPNEPWPLVTVASSSPPPLAASRTRAAPKSETPAKPATSKPATIAPITAILQKVDDTTTGIGWTGIDGDQLLAVLHPQPGKDEPAKVPFTDVTELVLKKSSTSSPPTTSPSTRPTESLPNARVMLSDDDRLVGTLIGWSDKRIRFRPNLEASTTIEIPVTSFRQLWCGSADQIKKAQATKEEAGLEDIAYAAKEDDVIAVRGIVIGIDGDSLHFRYDNADRKIALNRLVGIVMAKPEEMPGDDALYESVQFINDDQLSGKLLGIDGKNLSLQTRAGSSVRVPIEQIAKIITHNGRLTYLGDLKPAKVEQIPYFDRVMEYRVDKSLNGKPITLADGTYPHGISVHSRCVLTYNLDGRFNEFRSKVGFLLPEGKVGQAAIRLTGDGKTLYENLDARGDQPPADLKIPVANVRELKLEVDYGKNDDVGDRVAWANARLLRAGK